MIDFTRKKAESTQIGQQKLKLNYKSSSNVELKLSQTPESEEKNYFSNKEVVCKSLDSRVQINFKENFAATEETKENLLEKEEVRLNTELISEEYTSLLTSADEIKKKKKKLPPLKASAKMINRELRENSENFHGLNSKLETFESVRQENSQNSLPSNDFTKNLNADEIKEFKESEEVGRNSRENSVNLSNSDDISYRNLDKIIGRGVKLVEEPSDGNSGLRIPIIDVESSEQHNNQERRTSKVALSKFSYNRQASKKKSFFAGIFKSISNKINPISEKENQDPIEESQVQGTIYKNTGGTYSYGVLSKISKAVKIFKDFVRFKKIEALEPNQISIINDWCWYGPVKLHEEMMESNIRVVSFHQKLIIRIAAVLNFVVKRLTFLAFCFEYLAGLGGRIKVFNPKSRFKMIWDLINMIIIFWNFMNISTALCFGEPIENVFLLGKVDNARYLYYFFILATFLEMIIDNLFTLNTSFYEMGALVSDRKRIFKNYLRKNLLIDLIAEVPVFVQLMNYESNVSSFSQRYFNCLFFLKYYNLKGVFKVLEEFLALDDKYEASFDLFKLFLKIFFVAHILACLWHSVAYFKSDPEEKNWLSFKCLDKEGDWTERYIYAIYFALTTMSTVGYGDIIPQSQGEVSIAMLSMIVGSGMFGYALNNIGELLKRINHKEDRLKKEIRSLDRLMKSKNIDFELQTRARKYLEYVWNEEKQVQQNEEEILGKLSQTLREEVFLQSHGKILKMYPILFKNFSEKTMRQLIHMIHPVRYSPEELIFEEGDQFSDGFLYMITQGEIELSLAPQRREEKHCSVKILKRGSSFGEISFFTGLSQEFSAVSLNYSTVYLLKKSEFLSIIRENTDDWESFCMMRDKYLLYGDMMDFHMKCFSCNDNHPFRKCPALRYSPTRYKILIEHQKKVQKSKLQRRSLPQPRKIFRFHALKGRDIVYSKSIPFTKLEGDSKNEDEEEENKEHVIGNFKPDSDVKTSLEIKLEKNRKKKENLVQEAPKSSSNNETDAEPSYMRTPDLNLRRRNSNRRPTLTGNTEGSQKTIPPFGIRKISNRVETNAKEKTEANLNRASVHVPAADEQNPIKNPPTLPENKDELFMMNFDLTKNLSKYFVYNNPLTVIFWMNFRKKKKISTLLSKKSKKIATVFKMINKRKSGAGSQVPKLMNTPRNSGFGQKLYFQSE